MKTHIVLVPGFWLGAWAWDAVLPHLQRPDTHVTALTLPGLESVDSPRNTVTLDSHVSAIVDAVSRSDERTILVVHSGAGASGYAATDRVPDQIARIVYVDSGPMPDGTALRPDLAVDAIEVPLPPWAELEADGSSIEGLDDDALTAFRDRAVPEPAGAARDQIVLTDPRRYSVPTTVVCSSYPSDVIKQMADGGFPIAVELAKLPVTYVDLPTGHWPMWSRPKELAETILDAADA
ncbi:MULTISPECIES: alpha/beta fold hydrolase [Rhodococcus]|uniref:Alpha/beta hydrolase n=1 Tax=Rhodococcus globerulus TaxID=33008 RepID=A0ABU4BYT9_RHOGO|nr:MULTISPECIES: alpha/beta hydrolase [Rhodococcus]MDV6269412.1 alpha/beta hydrolase [Rhodococcus globerulus]MDV8066760.1 alpha/beta hydrolase [Rhodococcus sp. IEGM 1366]